MKIFISHVSKEGLLALVLKEWIQKLFNKRLKVFVSSDIQNISAGDKWLENLRQALESTRLLIVLCSPYSITRAWVNFEAGSGWFKQIPVIPICYSGQKLENLPSPLFLFHGLDIDPADFPDKLIASLMIKGKLRKRPRLGGRLRVRMKKEIEAALRRIAETTPARSTKPSQDRVGLILKKIATANDEDCTWNRLAASLKMDPNDLDVYLRHLMDRRFIIRKTEKKGDPWYTTTKMGRNFLIQQDLLGT